MSNSKLAGTGTDNRCVARAISTIRAVLGYKTPLPKNFPRDGGIETEYTVANCHKWFPNHSVSVWCSESFKGITKDWRGETFYNATDAGLDYICMFDYGKQGDRNTHMVVGYPSLFDGMCCGSIIRVSLKEK